MERLRDILKGRVVLAGVGATERGDDGFGVRLARSLKGLPNLRVIDCGERLEDYTGDIARENPDTVLIADAADLGATPGSVCLLRADDLPSGLGDTHRAPLGFAMTYLAERTGARVFLLGMQPAALADGEGLSRPVEAATRWLTDLLRGWSGANGSQPLTGTTTHES